MNEFWNLDPLYKGFEDPQYEADMTALKQKVAEMAALAGELDAVEPLTGLRRGIELQEAVQELTMKLAEYAQLRQSANTRDGEAGSRMGHIVLPFQPTTELMLIDFSKKIKNRLPDNVQLVKIFLKETDGSFAEWIEE